MDIIKERMVALSPRWNSESRKWGLKLRANVHDEVVSSVPLEVLQEPGLHEFVLHTLEDTDIKYRVPIKFGLGIGKDNWSQSAGDVKFEDGTGKLV
jgi:DNA polymerase I-like protein with 3'-5' exonuclease and polymerase domains